MTFLLKCQLCNKNIDNANDIPLNIIGEYYYHKVCFKQAISSLANRIHEPVQLELVF